MQPQLSENEIVENYRNHLTNVMNQINDEAWSKSYSEGKATVAEIVGHLMGWDKYVIEQVIPSVVRGDGMQFPDFDTYNKQSYEYTKSRSRETILSEFISTRNELCVMLSMLTNEQLCGSTTIGGSTHDAHTGKAFSLLFLIEEFTEHDHHHKKQLETILGI